MNNLYLDIETIPSQEKWVRDYIADTVKPPATMKKEETIKKWYEEEFDNAVDEALTKTSFDGAMCHVIAIGYAVKDNPAKCIYAEKHTDEAKILKSFFKGVSTLSWPNVVGHNVTGFDLKILRQRAMILGVAIPRNIPWDAKPWDKNPFDTMVQWDAKNFIKLDKLARAMDIQGKDGVDGSMVYKLWKNGEHDRLREYCKSDVEMVREVANRMMCCWE